MDAPFRIDAGLPSLLDQLRHRYQAPDRSKLPDLPQRLPFWRWAWGTVHGRCSGTRRTRQHPSLPADVRLIQPEHIVELVRRIDHVFWADSLHHVLWEGLGWSLSVVIQGHQRNLGMRPSDYPIMNVAVHRSQRRIELVVQGHPAYYRRYPARCDGVRVNNWQEHLAHAVAHEMVHMVRVALLPRSPSMYDGDFDLLNLWVYGHTGRYDEDDGDDTIEVSD